MGTLHARDVDDAVSSMRVLEETLYEDLDYVEMSLSALAAAPRQDSDDIEEVHVLRVTRAALLSGLQSIHEVLQWVKIKAATDAEGNELEILRKLPQLEVKDIS